ncbi:hypothetical protein RGU70_13605 [Herbaspirillum sp. RTI4]|uniref:hypothetical protein n=1 Tax=Herbaspirillum sp. RTI4 TaxID=3048640 RepID=UPI002AB35C43|nr:hypothetical protein [Herbaspirillum sp. RTI4]MDY7579349.1 hypothetical protein [Herbaspirillum sp. RTI4]MEA9980263.1 hypothetical protein [Herbaspirillum sp. RTI4]
MITSTTRLAGPYAGTGLQTAFPFAFKVFQASDVLVLLTNTSGNNTVLALTSAYSVTLNSNQDTSPGGSVTLVSAPAAGYLLTMTSQVAELQQTNLTNAGNFYPQTVNNALDYLTILIQQLATSVGNSIQIPLQSSGISTTLPAPKAGLGLGWNAAGNSITNIDFTGASAASSSSAASSAAAAANSATASVAAAAALNYSNTQLAAGIVTFNNFDLGFVSDTPPATVIDLGTVH